LSSYKGTANNRGIKEMSTPSEDYEKETSKSVISAHDTVALNVSGSTERAFEKLVDYIQWLEAERTKWKALATERHYEKIAPKEIRTPNCPHCGQSVVSSYYCCNCDVPVFE
jgi:hypothetical protein